MTDLTRGVVCIAILLLVLTTSASAQQDGDGSVTVSGELKQWHKVTLTIAGPFARETDTQPNPFTDYNLMVRFTHESGGLSYDVPGYFAADGEAAETSAKQGHSWRVHFASDRPGKWSYAVMFLSSPGIAMRTIEEIGEVTMLTREVVGHGRTGSFTIDRTDKTGRDLRAHGRLQYIGERYLRFAGSGEYFLKAGADAPETLLAYADFDDTTAKKKNAPLKTWAPHVKDWRRGDPTWQGSKGRGLIGAINYLSSTDCNAFSFLTYNAGGDGDNVWPFVSRDDKLHYDCSKLDQWQIVFDHAQSKGMYLHFKLQETENDDNRAGKNNGLVPESLDGGDLGPERRLYLRELVARFGYHLALNWNLGEENTQTAPQQRAMAKYIKDIDPYDHPIVIHTYPNEQDKVYGALLGDQSVLNGASVQNSDVRDCHWQVVKWVNRSNEAGRPWVVAFDEPGDASFGQPPDPDYPGMDKIDKVPLTVDDVRKYALWGTLMAGGAGVEYYFGYKLPQNDLNCEDWRSREKSWKSCNIALTFFRDHKIPLWEMESRDDLIGADAKKNEGYCLAKPGELYLIYLPEPRATIELELGDGGDAYMLHWFNPRQGGALILGTQINAAGKATLQGPPTQRAGEDWLAVVRRSR